MTGLKARVRDRLDGIVDPCSRANGTNLSIVEMGLIEDVEVEDGHVTVSMRLTSPFCMQIPYFIDEAEEQVGGLDGVESVAVETDKGFEWTPDMMTEEARERREERHRAVVEEYRTEGVRAENAPAGNRRS